MSTDFDATLEAVNIVLELIKRLRSDGPISDTERHQIAEDFLRMLNGETFDDVFGINRKHWSKQKNEARDYWLALDYWIRRKQAPRGHVARVMGRVAYDWNVGDETVKRLARIYHRACEDYIAQNALGPDGLRWLQSQVRFARDRVMSTTRLHDSLTGAS
jgi:hypothetical protein